MSKADLRLRLKQALGADARQAAANFKAPDQIAACILGLIHRAIGPPEEFVLSSFTVDDYHHAKAASDAFQSTDANRCTKTIYQQELDNALISLVFLAVLRMPSMPKYKVHVLRQLLANRKYPLHLGNLNASV